MWRLVILAALLALAVKGLSPRRPVPAMAKQVTKHRLQVLVSGSAVAALGKGSAPPQAKRRLPQLSSGTVKMLNTEHAQGKSEAEILTMPCRQRSRELAPSPLRAPPGLAAGSHLPEERMIREKALKQRRARERRAKAMISQRRQIRGLSLLEERSVQDSTMKSYVELLNRFWGFAAAFRWEVKSSEGLDKALSAYADECYLEGENVEYGLKLKAALEAVHLEYQQEGRLWMPRFQRSLKGWRRLAPGRSRLPCPEEFMWCVAGYMIARGHAEMALWVALVFSAYLRPSEGRRVAVGDIVPPARDASHSMRQWVLLLFSWEKQQSSKTGQFDETVALDDSRMPWLGPLLKWWGEARLRQVGPVADPEAVPLWSFTAKKLLHVWNNAVEDLRFSADVHCTYQLRHGGASRDHLQKLRSQLEIQGRGRWAVAQSMRQYDKPGRLQQMLTKCPRELLVYVENVRIGFEGFIRSGTCPEPPLKRRRSS